MSKLYAIVDIETTGVSTNRDKITEVAILLHDGHRVTDSFATLINPECYITPFITGLTGITNDMVADAPKFHEVAKKIIEWTEGRIFVAHNVHFDYGFIKEEFRSLGYTFTRNTLDTVRLSRLAFPGWKSYSLGNIIQQLNIIVKERHRALADAAATAELFTMIMQSGAYTGSVNDYITMGLKSSKLPPGISLDDILQLPDTHGVYYFKNKEGALLYVGKSKNIKSRIAQHFTQHSEKSLKLRQRTHSIDYLLTGNELAALIKESMEIRTLKPVYNVTQRNPSFPYVVIVEEIENTPRLITVKSKELIPGKKTVKHFTHKKLADSFIQNKYLEINDEALKNGITAYFDPKGKSIQFVSKDNLAQYTNIFYSIINSISLWFEEDMLIQTEGRQVTEKCLFLILHGKFYGYEYFDNDTSIQSIDNLLHYISPIEYHPDLDQLIHTYLRKNPGKIKITKLNAYHES